MTSNIEHLARKFELTLAPKVGAKRGTQMSPKKIHKELNKARATYKEARSKLRGLESDLSRLEDQISECRDIIRSSRATMLKMNGVIQNIHLSDANYAVFYDTNDAVGYMIGGEEKYLDMSEDGEINISPWRQRNRLKRQMAGEDAVDDAPPTEAIPPSIVDDAGYEDPQQADDSDSDDSDDDNDSDDNDSDDNFAHDFANHPNFRFID